MTGSDDDRGQAVTGEFDEFTTRIMPDRGVVHLHLLRHGEVDRLTDRVVRGQLDVALSQRGAEQSDSLARWMTSGEPAPDEVWSSDLERCRVLAEAVARPGVRVRYDERLREQNMGDWQGKTWHEITAQDGPAVTAYWDDYANATPTGGESYAELHARVASWWSDVLPELADKRIVVATHIGVIRSLTCSLLNVPIAESLRFAPAVGSHTSFLISEAGAVLCGFGERPWLFDGASA
jgi:alpha-ribazole phosphatase